MLACLYERPLAALSLVPGAFGLDFLLRQRWLKAVCTVPGRRGIALILGLDVRGPLASFPGGDLVRFTSGCVLRFRGGPAF